MAFQWFGISFFAQYLENKSLEFDLFQPLLHYFQWLVAGGVSEQRDYNMWVEYLVLLGHNRCHASTEIVLIFDVMLSLSH